MVPQQNGTFVMGYMPARVNNSFIPVNQVSQAPSGYFAGGTDPVMGEVEKLYRQYGPDSNPGLVQDVMRLVGDQPASSGWNNAGYPQGVPPQYAAAQNTNQFAAMFQKLFEILDSRNEARFQRLEQAIATGKASETTEETNEKFQEGLENRLKFLNGIKDGSIQLSLAHLKPDEKTKYFKRLDKEIRNTNDAIEKFEDGDYSGLSKLSGNGEFNLDSLKSLLAKVIKINPGEELNKTNYGAVYDFWLANKPEDKK